MDGSMAIAAMRMSPNRESPRVAPAEPNGWPPSGTIADIGVRQRGPSLERPDDRVFPNALRSDGIELRRQRIRLAGDVDAVRRETQRQIGVIRQQQPIAVEHRARLKAFELQPACAASAESAREIVSGL